MKKPKFSLARKDDEFFELVKITDKRTLAIWAAACAARVLKFFEEKHPVDSRPFDALETLREWIKTGKFSMSVIRRAALDSHAAARETGTDDAARSAARAAGQAVATAHVATHSYAAALYAQQATHRNAGILEAESAAQAERDWQFRHLIELRKDSGAN